MIGQINSVSTNISNSNNDNLLAFIGIINGNGSESRILKDEIGITNISIINGVINIEGSFNNLTICNVQGNLIGDNAFGFPSINETNIYIDITDKDFIENTLNYVVEIFVTIYKKQINNNNLSNNI